MGGSGGSGGEYAKVGAGICGRGGVYAGTG
jgi:hypothetical protein